MSKANTDFTYTTAMSELQNIVEQLQTEAIDMDQLSKKVQRAATLIHFCQKRLRSTESEINAVLNTKE